MQQRGFATFRVETLGSPGTWAVANTNAVPRQVFFVGASGNGTASAAVPFTLTAEQIWQGSMCIYAGANGTVTLPTGTSLDTYLAGLFGPGMVPVGFYFMFRMFMVAGNANRNITLGNGASGMSEVGQTAAKSIGGSLSLFSVYFQKTRTNTWIAIAQ
jgi:hypothetical protein